MWPGLIMASVTWSEMKRKSSIGAAALGETSVAGCDDAEKFEAEASAPNREVIPLLIGADGQVIEEGSRSGVAGFDQVHTSARYQ